MSKKYEYETYTEWYDNNYHTITKVFDMEKVDASWRGCHWDNPAIIKSEVVNGVMMSHEMANFISISGASRIEEADY